MVQFGKQKVYIFKENFGKLNKHQCKNLRTRKIEMIITPLIIYLRRSCSIFVLFISNFGKQKVFIFKENFGKLNKRVFYFSIFLKKNFSCKTENFPKPNTPLTSTSYPTYHIFEKIIVIPRYTLKQSGHQSQAYTSSAQTVQSRQRNSKCYRVENDIQFQTYRHIQLYVILTLQLNLLERGTIHLDEDRDKKRSLGIRNVHHLLHRVPA
ncbi:hypothetical protein LXL04_009262 [Taraxacum kok-saghyz]